MTMLNREAIAKLFVWLTAEYVGRFAFSLDKYGDFWLQALTDAHIEPSDLRDGCRNVRKYLATLPPEKVFAPTPAWFAAQCQGPAWRARREASRPKKLPSPKGIDPRYAHIAHRIRLGCPGRAITPSGEAFEAWRDGLTTEERSLCKV